MKQRERGGGEVGKGRMCPFVVSLTLDAIKGFAGKVRLNRIDSNLYTAGDSTMSTPL